MDKAKIMLTLQSCLCILSVIMLISAATGLYRKGAKKKAEDPSKQIFTKEEVQSAAAPGFAVMMAGVGLAIAGLIFGIKDEKDDAFAADAELSKELTDRRGQKTQMSEEEKRQTALRKKRVRICILAAAFLFIIIGIANGSMHDVLVKAIKICTECIGLG